MIFATRVTRKVRCRPLKGLHTPSDALELLLEGTGLVAKRNKNTGVFAIVRAEANQPARASPNPGKSLSSQDSEPNAISNPTIDSANNMNQTKLVKSVIAAGALAASGFAQDSEDEDDVYELSPFTVEASSNNGYQATSTLAGTRLNTALKDVAATVSVITPEFLEDTNSDDLQELLVYTANTEIPGIGGNFANPDGGTDVGGITDQQFQRPATNTRVRGLAAADLTRNYFSTVVPMDSYNTNRVVINRGANATLFGLGSPAGIINNSTITPYFRDHGKVSLQVGSYDSMRTSIDLEKVLVEDKLSLRIASLYEDRKYAQDPAFERDERIFLVSEFRLAEGSKFRVSYESGSITANRPRTIPPQDMVSRWFDTAPNGIAKPPHDPTFNNRLRLFFPGGDTTGRTPADVADQQYFGPIGFTFDPVIVYSDPSQSVGNGNLANGSDGFIAITHPRYGRDITTAFEGFPGFNFQSFGTIRGYNQLLGGMPGEPRDQNGNLLSATRDFYVNEVIQDTSIFDFRNLLIDGPNKRELEDFDVFSASFEQTFWEGKAGLSYNFNKEEYSNDFMTILGNGTRFQSIAIDPNLNIPHVKDANLDPIPNPNFGRLMITAGSRGGTSTTQDDRENNRFTGFVKLDATENIDGLLGQILGSHTITGLHENAKNNTRNINFQNYMFGPEFNATGNSVNVNNLSPVGTLVYVSGDISGQSTAAGANASNMSALLDFQSSYNLSILNRDTGLPVIRSYDVVSDIPWGGSLNRSEIDSQAIILSSQFLNGHLVTTYGYREDDVSIWSTPAPPRLSDGSRDISPSAFFLPESPTFGSESDATNFGIVAHLPYEWMNKLPGDMGLSLHYAKSDNVQIGRERTNLMGEKIGPVSGETTEKGFTVSFMENKISLRVNWYETLQIGEDSGLTSAFNNLLGPYLGNYTDAGKEATIAANVLQQPDIENLRNFDPLGNAQYVVETMNLVESDDGLRVLRTVPTGLTFPTDLLSEGLEIEGVANLNDNWRLFFNVSQQQVSATNTAPLLSKLIEETIEPQLAEFGHFPANDGQNETMASFTNRFGLITSKVKIAEDGGVKTNEIREWRWNLGTNYTFSEDSRFKGWNVGGAARWQDSVGIGRPVINDPELGFIPDLANPIYGSNDLKVDAWVGWSRPLAFMGVEDIDWQVQLNIRNLLDNDDLIPVVANPDGTIPVYRIPAERTWELRSTFTF